MKKYFPSSELIINEDGSVFHLHVKPEWLADKVILVGDPGRVALVASHFENKECEVDASHIEVSVPKQEDVEVAPLMGRIEYFNAAKGYGFVKDADNGEKYFFHISSAPATIAEGDRVTFEIERGMRGMNAVRISIVTE